MKIAAQGHFRKFSTEFEGCVPWMYLDVKGLVTVGVGNLIEPVSESYKLPFRHKDTKQPATQQEIEQEWRRVKAATQLAQQGHRAAQSFTKLELSDAEIGKLVMKRLLENEALVRNHPAFSQWDKWPADAQLAVMSMCWAVGFRGLTKFPKFCMAAARNDFAVMEAECEISTVGNPGVKPRNAANRTCFLNAAAVARNDLDPEMLHYPDKLEVK